MRFQREGHQLDAASLALQAIRSLPGAGVAILDLDHVVQFADGPLLHGHPLGEATGEPLESAFDPGLAAELDALIARAAAGELAATSTETARRAGFMAEMVPLRDHVGEVTAVLVVFQDLTLQLRGALAERVAERVREAESAERAAAAQERGQLEQRFAAAFEASPVGMGLLSANGRWMRVNAALCRITGYDERALTELSLSDSFTTASLVEFQEARELIDRGERDSFETEAPMLCADGDERRLAIVSTAVRDEHGAVGHYVVQVQDITGRVEHEHALIASERTALEASAMKSRFVANISHELRTPMSGVIGMLELLEQSDGLSAEQRDMVRKATGAADMLLKIINDVLDLSKVEHGRFDLGSELIDLDGLLDDVRSTFAHACDAKGVTLRTGRDAVVGRSISGDPTRLRQVLLNFVGNAVKFTDTGEIDVRITASAADRSLLRFEVTDTGIGIPAAEHTLLFEPFHQADSSSTRRHGGTGLGLAIAKELVLLMGGEVGVDSTPGHGSRFWFTIRPTDGHSDLLTAPGDVPDAQPEPLDVRGKRVLVVEDNAVNQQIAVRRLERRGVDVDVADNGARAVELASAGAYDLILMDCYMPELDGFAATARIRDAEGATQHTPIVAMTAGALEDDRRRCESVGMDGFLAKPVRQSDLDVALARWLA